MLRPLAIAAAAFALLAAPARADTLHGIPAPPVTIIHAACPDLDAPSECAIGDVIYTPANADRFAVQHGIGHEFDHAYLDDGERHALIGRLGLTDRPWRTGTGLAGLRSPSERFADAYAACRLGLDPKGERTPWETGYDYQPTRKALRLVCSTIRRAALDPA